MDYVYSAKNNVFFPVILLSGYESAGWDISDVIPVAESVFIEFSSFPPCKARKAGEDGMPMWVDAPDHIADEITTPPAA